jgi:hypothetical protein
LWDQFHAAAESVNTKLGDILAINQNVPLAEFQEPEQDREQCAFFGSSAVNVVELGLMRMLTSLRTGFSGRQGTVVQDNDVVNLGEEGGYLGDQDTGLAMKSVEETFLEDGAPNMGVESSKGVIQQVDVRIGIESMGQGKTGLLAAGQVSTTFDDLTRDTVGKVLKVSGEGSAPIARLSR